MEVEPEIEHQIDEIPDESEKNDLESLLDFSEIESLGVDTTMIMQAMNNELQEPMTDLNDDLQQFFGAVGHIEQYYAQLLSMDKHYKNIFKQMFENIPNNYK
ncbi:hypothetical protein PCE1_002345 [Barthelona sp. PCE]